MKKAFTFLMAAAAALSLHAEVLWQADFSKSGEANLGGFTVARTAPKDSAKVEKGALVLNFNHGINKGMALKQEIPYPEKGEFSFDAIMNVGSKKGYGAWSVNMSLFGIFFAWNGSVNMGMCKFEPPTKWHHITKGTWNKVINYRIRYDRVKGTVDFYIDNALVPTKSFTGIKFPEPKDGKGVFSIGNYGYATGNLTHRITNMKLETALELENITEPTVVWTEKFEKNGSLIDNGYTQTMDNKKDQFLVQDGVLTAVCQNSPYKGSMFAKKFPGVIRGELSFEVAAGSGLGYDHYCFTMMFSGMTLSWNRGSQLHLYQGGKINKWFTVSSKIKSFQWQKYVIRFDTETKVAEYYIDDMENPAFIDTNSQIRPLRETPLVFKNYGLCNGTITNKIRNIELKAIPAEKKKSESVTLSGTFLMRGPSDLHWKYKDLTAKLGEEVSEFSVAPSGYHVSNAPNAFYLFPKPKLRMPLYKYIVLADMPYKPIPDYVVKHILNSVKNGGKLIILGGYFTLQKGGYVGTDFEPILPVSIKDRWKEVTALPDAKVFQFNGKDAVIYKPYGKGMVYVLPGNPVQDTALPDVYNHFTF